MTRRLTLDDMHETAALRGGRCLSITYHNVSVKLEWECSNGHRWFAPANRIRYGSWCPICSRRSAKTQRRYTIEDLKSLVKRRGGRCLSTSYLGSHAKHLWRCKNGHEWEATASSVIEGSWCPVCAINKNRLTIAEVRRFARKHGLRCLSEQCSSNQDPLKWRCSQGHEWSTTYNYLSSRPYCPVCHKEERRLKNLEQCRKIARRRGGECLSDSFVSVPGKMRWRCKNGHEWLATHTQIKAGHWCWECKWQKRRLGIERMREIARERGGFCLSWKYRSRTAPLKWRCAQGHEWEASYASIWQNSWCPQCAAEKQTGRATAKIVDLRDWAAEFGGWCLSFRYRNNKEPLLWECKKGHRFSMPWRRIRAGAWCPQCRTDEKQWTRRQKEADRLAKKDGYLAAAGYLSACHGGVCHSNAYHGNRGVLEHECAIGHHWNSTYHTLREGGWCPVCGEIQRHDALLASLGRIDADDEDELIYYAEEIGCQWVGDSTVKIGRSHLFTCTHGHLWESDRGGMAAQSWCPACGLAGTPLGKGRIVR